MKYIGGTKLDERIIRTDLDPGFKEGRQYGRGMFFFLFFCRVVVNGVRVRGRGEGRRGLMERCVGPTGGQVRDYYRDDYDPGRGGYGGREQRPSIKG